MFPHNPDSHLQTPHHHKHSPFLQQFPMGSLQNFGGHPQKMRGVHRQQGDCEK